MAWLPQTDFPLQTALEQIYIPKTTGWLTFQTVGQSQEGCIDTATLKIKVDSLIPKVFMPTAFSPNGDGHNDVFKPYFINKSGYEIVNFKVFNRYGQIVYNASMTANAGWMDVMRMAKMQMSELITIIFKYYLLTEHD